MAGIHQQRPAATEQAHASIARVRAGRCGDLCVERTISAADRARWAAQARRVLAPRPIDQREGVASRPALTRAAVFDAEALRAGSDYRQLLRARWRGPSPVLVASATDLGPLRAGACLHLGETEELGTLLAILPGGFVPMTCPDAMFGELAPEWAGCASRADELLSAAAEVTVAGASVRGLYWRGWDAHAEAWALSNAIARRGLAGARLWVGLGAAATGAGATPTLRTDALGRVTPSRADRLQVWSHDGDGYVSTTGPVSAALADLHLWWAWRLHGYAREVSGSAWDLYLAQRALHRGLSALRAMAGAIQHIDLHQRLGVGAR